MENVSRMKMIVTKEDDGDTGNWVLWKGQQRKTESQKKLKAESKVKVTGF